MPSSYYPGDDTDGSLLKILQPAPEPDHQKEVSRARGAAEEAQRASKTGTASGSGVLGTAYSVHGTELWRRKTRMRLAAALHAPHPKEGLRSLPRLMGMVPHAFGRIRKMSCILLLGFTGWAMDRPGEIPGRMRDIRGKGHCS